MVGAEVVAGEVGVQLRSLGVQMEQVLQILLLAIALAKVSAGLPPQTFA